MTKALAPGKQPNWKTGGLYGKICEILPEYRTRRGHLDVARIGADLRPRKSHEAVYKWLRDDRLLGKNVEALIALASTEQNADALRRLGRPLPTRMDFAAFL